MQKLWLSLLLVWAVAGTPQGVLADGVNTGLADPVVINGAGGSLGNGTGIGPLSATLQLGAVLPGSNQVGRPGISPDQVGGYEVNIAYDHVAVGMAIVGVLFLMTEWMDR